MYLLSKFFNSSLVQHVRCHLPVPSRAIRRTATRGYGLILHLFVVLEQYWQPDCGEQPCYPTSSTVKRSLNGHKSNTFTATFPSLSTSTENNSNSWIRTYLASLYCTRPVLAIGSWGTALLCNVFNRGKITKWPLVQHASTFYNHSRAAQLSNNILVSSPYSSELSS